jgi:hypothetical protein
MSSQAAMKKPSCALKRPSSVQKKPSRPRLAVEEASRSIAFDDVATLLLERMEREVAREVAQVRAIFHGAKRPGGSNSLACRFCPFRVLPRRSSYLAHLQTYHTKSRLFCASYRHTVQWHMARALVDQDTALEVLRPCVLSDDLLETTPGILRTWNPIGEYGSTRKSLAK